MIRSRFGERLRELTDRGEVHRCVFANGGVRAAAGFYAANAIGRERLAADQELGVFARVDIVGHDGDLKRVAKTFAERVDQSGFARADGATHSRSLASVGRAHVLLVTMTCVCL